jgi:hypothetical protein
MNLYTLLATLSSNSKILGIQETCERIEGYAQHKQKPSTRKVSLSHVKKPVVRQSQKRGKNKTLYVDQDRNARERAQQTAQRAVLIAETNLP